MRSLLAAGLYVLLLLPVLVAPIGRVKHAHAYLMEMVYRGGAHLAVDMLVNVVLFLPLGWLLHRAARRQGATGRTSLVLVVAAGGLFSLSVETLQYFLATRYSSGVDVATNAVGAWAGAWAEARRSAAACVAAQPPR
jgi:glycopeptide antibiotics resistance protein